MIQMLMLGAGRLATERAALLSRQFDVIVGARRGRRALDIVAHEAVDLLATPERLPDMTATDLAKQLRRWHPVRRPRMVLLRAGEGNHQVDHAEFDVVIDASQPPSTVCACIAAASRDASVRRKIDYSCKGVLKRVGLAALMRAIWHGSKTGQLVVENGHRSGYILYRNGQLVRASFDGFEGRDALVNLLAEQAMLSAAHFHFEPWSSKAAEGIRPTINGQLDRLLFDEA